MVGVAVISVFDNPKLKEDVTLFKILLTPLELYVLKFFIINLRPTNIREVYTNAISICFFNLFLSGVSIEGEEEAYLKREVLNAGYGFGIVGEKDKKEVKRKYYDSVKGLSETELSDIWLEQIKKYNSKTPSYDKIKAIFSKFEQIGILNKLGKDGKGIVYILSPDFYTTFKDDRHKIVSL